MSTTEQPLHLTEGIVLRRPTERSHILTDLKVVGFLKKCCMPKPG